MTDDQKTKLIELFKALRARLEPEKAWIKGAYARTAEGNTIGSYNPEAACWCLVGGINSVTPYNKEGLTDLGSEFRELMLTTLWEVYSSNQEASYLAQNSLERFNDCSSTTKEDVLELIDRTIAKLEAEEVAEA